MLEKKKYEVPEVEITRFETSMKIMNSVGGGNDTDDGDIKPYPGYGESDQDPGNAPLPLWF